MRLSQNIYLVGSGKNGLYLTDEWDCNCYILDFGNMLVMFDSGLGLHPELIEGEIMADGLKAENVKYLFLTHCHADHAGGAAYFKRKYGLQVIAPKWEAGFLEKGDESSLGLVTARKAGYYPVSYNLSPCKSDGTVTTGEMWKNQSCSFEIFAARGHSIGGVCYYGSICNKRFLISGDLVTGEGKISFQLIPGADIHAYAASVEKLRYLEVDILLPGHGIVQMQNGGRVIKKAAADFEHLFIPT